MKHLMISMFKLIGLASLVIVSIDIAIAQPSANVGVYAEHYGGKFVYHYRVLNNGTGNIASVRIGYNSQNDAWELLELPSGWDFYKGIPLGSATSPQGWRVYVITPEGIPGSSINWGVIDNNSPRILAGQTQTNISITLDKADNNYLTAHAVINTNLTVPLQRLDTTPPSLSLTLNPSVLHSNDRLVPIAAQITVKDDYDPLPDIKLVSITANEPLEAEDIRGAVIGKDTRRFSLRADHNERSKTARIYTVTYSATDASGNTSTASATVTVAREQEDHADKHSVQEKSVPQKSPPARGGAGALPF